MAHVLDSGGMYGIEQALVSLLPRLREQSAPVMLVCLQRRGTPGAAVGKAVAAHGVPVQYVDAGGVNPAGVVRLFRTLRSLRVRAIHTHGYKATILAGSFGAFRRIPLVATYHAEAAHAAGVQRWVAMETHVLRRITAVAAVSEPIRSELARRGVPPERIRVIPNGIEDPGFGPRRVDSPAKTYAPALVSVGRLVPEKNLRAALHALAMIRKRHDRAGLVIAGDGPLRAELVGLANQWGIADAVRLVGFTMDVARLLRESDCFLLPSRTEGVPIALLEAMAVGVPIVASRVGGIPETVRHRQEALLVPSGSLADFADAIEAIIASQPLAEALRTAARKRFEQQFTAARMADRYVELYRAFGIGLEACEPMPFPPDLDERAAADSLRDP